MKCNVIVNKYGDICGAKWRRNYSHGRKSKPFKVYIREHNEKCKYNEVKQK